MGASSAWNNDGTVPVTNNIPLGAVRNAVFKYGDIVRNLVKFTLNGITYDIQKQSMEGLVVVGSSYSSVTFFLPDSREPLTEEDFSNMTLMDYLKDMAETDYCEIKAWDYFAQYVATMASSILGENAATTPFPYSITLDNLESYGGEAYFATLSSMRDFFNAIYTTVDAAAESCPLANGNVGDGSVSMVLTLMPDSENPVSMPLYIGRK